MTGQGRHRRRDEEECANLPPTNTRQDVGPV